MLTAPPIKISNHAVFQYRARVLACPERYRPDKMLRPLIEDQVRLGSWECAGGETFQIKCGMEMPKKNKPWDYKVVSVTYRYVIECQTVVTVLGFNMRPNKRAIQRRRRRQRLKRLTQQFGDKT